MKRISIILVSFICCIWFDTNAQIDDSGLWTGFTIEHKFTRRLSADLTQQIRLYKDLAAIDQVYIQGSVNYSLLKNLRASIGYRFSKKDREGYYSDRFRWQADLAYRYKVSKLVLQLRERIQRQVVDPYASDNGDIPEYIWRNRLTIKGDLNKKYAPYVSAEAFFLLSNVKRESFQLNRMRYEVGLDYEFNRMHSINPFLLFQYSIPDMKNRLVYGLTYTLSI